MIEEGGGRQDVVQSYVGEGTRDVRRGGRRGEAGLAAALSRGPEGGGSRRYIGA